jgi:hypothetical protein
MKRQNWWDKKGLLTSGRDPTPELALAAAQFPDEYAPMVFMTGDGHGHPPFQWAEQANWSRMFEPCIAANLICCHVETYSDAVTVESVPKMFSDVFHNQKVFGWEPDVFRIIQSISETLNALRAHIQLKKSETVGGIGNVELHASDIRSLSSMMWRVHDHGYLKAEGKVAMAYWDAARDIGKRMIRLNELPGYADFLTDYSRAGMQLRVVANDAIGANIQRKIQKFPDHMHLITCGNAHILHNPLYLYIQPPLGTFGIVDELK